jgi:hypothetical protein
LIQSLLPLIRLFDFSCPLTIFIFICLFTKFRLAYEGYAGGVLTVSRDQYEAINGFSNEFWGWGGEDDDLTNRLKSRFGGVTRNLSRTRASFFSLSHPLVVANPNRFANNHFNLIKIVIYQMLLFTGRKLLKNIRKVVDYIARVSIQLSTRL